MLVADRIAVGTAIELVTAGAPFKDGDATERRPHRTVVMPEGMDYGVERLNAAVAPIRNNTLKMPGMESME